MNMFMSISLSLLFFVSFDQFLDWLLAIGTSPIMPLHFIVIGNPISHSKSPQIHHAFAKQVGLDICYQRQYCPNDANAFTAVVGAFFAGGGIGANVTVPFKQTAHQLCQQTGRLTAQAELAQAVNTLYQQDGVLVGHNTDGNGLVNHLHQLGWLSSTNSTNNNSNNNNSNSNHFASKKVAIIGAGGATRGIILPLLSAGIHHIDIANRTVDKAKQLICDLHSKAKQMPNDIKHLFAQASLSACAIDALTGHYHLIINATSVGLSDSRLPLSEHLRCQHAYDLMYGRELPFLQHFDALGADTSDGMGMLIGQAALSFKQWTGKSIDTSQIYK